MHGSWSVFQTILAELTSLLELMKLELQNKFCNNQRFEIDSYPTNLDLLAFRFALFMLTVYSFMY